MFKKSRRLLSIVLILCMVLAILPAAANDASAATFVPSTKTNGNRYVWSTATISPTFNNKGEITSCDLSAPSGSANNSDNVKVYLSENGIDWSEPIAAYSGTGNAGYYARYIKIVPADGYYIQYAVVACHDDDNRNDRVNHGYGCQSVGNGSGYTEGYDMSTGTIILDATSVDGTGMNFYHSPNGGTPFHILIQISETLDPVYVVYDAGEAAASFSSSDPIVSSTVGPLYGFNVTAGTSGSSVAFRYEDSDTTPNTPRHTVLAPSETDVTINGTKYKFSHWKVENYLNVADESASYPALSGLVATSGENYSAMPDSPYYLGTHTKLIAIWEPVKLYVTKELKSIGGTAVSAGSPVIAKDGDEIIWDITVTNDDSVDAEEIALLDTMEDAISGITLIDWDGYIVNGNEETLVTTPDAYTFDVPAGTSKTFRVKYTVGDDDIGRVLLNAATIGSNSDDSDPVFTFVKTLVTSADKPAGGSDLADAIEQLNITYPNGTDPIEMAADDSVTLLYKITVTGNEGAEYTLADEGAMHVYGPYANGKVTIPTDNDSDSFGVAEVWFAKTFSNIQFDAEGKATLGNSAVLNGTVTTGEEYPAEEKTEIEVVKTVVSVGGVRVTDQDSIPSAVEYDTVIWNIAVTNKGQAPLTDLTLEDHLHCHCDDAGHNCGAVTVTPGGSFSLEGGETKNFTATYVITAENIGHDLHNAATVKHEDDTFEDESPAVPTMAFKKSIVTSLPNGVPWAGGSAPSVDYPVDNIITLTDDAEKENYEVTLLYALELTGIEGETYYIEDVDATYVGISGGEYLGTTGAGVVNIKLPVDNDPNVEGTATVYVTKSFDYHDIVSKVIDGTETDVLHNDARAWDTTNKTLTDDENTPVTVDWEEIITVDKTVKSINDNAVTNQNSIPAVSVGDVVVWEIVVTNHSNEQNPEVELSITDLINGDIKIETFNRVPQGETTDKLTLESGESVTLTVQYIVTADEISTSLKNVATVTDGTTEFSDEAPEVTTMDVEKTLVATVEEYTDSVDSGVVFREQTEVFDPESITWPGYDNEGNVNTLIIGEEEPVTLLYKITVTGKEGVVYHLIDNNSTFVGVSNYDAYKGTSHNSATNETSLLVEIPDDGGDYGTVDVYVTRTFTTSDISDGQVSNIAVLYSDPSNTTEDEETVLAEVEEPEDPGFDFDIDIGVIPAPVTGAVSVTKTVSGLVVSSGAEFKFSIYNESGSLVKTIRLEAGQSRTIDGLAPGTYTIVETGSAMFGYSLRTYINGSYRPDGAYEFEVYAGEETGISVNNRYTVAAALNTNDHFAYIVGYSDGTVKPNNPITRAEVATIFFRLMTDESREAYWSNTNSFDDVSADKWYNNAISTLQNAGILDGTSFRPNDNITRAELAVIATKFSQMSNTAAGSVTFTDVQGHWAQAEIEYAAAIGWVKGYSDGTFRPDQQITRAEAMTLINRVLERAVKEDGMEENMVAWPDNTPDAWYYEDVQEATNSHYYVRAKNQPVEGYDFNYEVWRGIMEPRDWTELEKSWAAAAVSASEIILS